MWRVAAWAFASGGLVLLLSMGPLLAQPVLVTNTPLPPPLMTNTPLRITTTPRPLMTNTPQPTAFPGPALEMERYALRRWDEAAFANVLIQQIGLLQPGDSAVPQGIRLVQHEVGIRFPGAPRDPNTRLNLLQAQLAAPPGLVDMRAEVRAYLESNLNTVRPSLESPLTLEIAPFQLSLTPANIDGRGAMDAVIQTRYPATGEAHYEDYALLVVDEQGAYRVPVSSVPAAPLGAVSAVELERIGDLNGDSLDEVAIRVVTLESNRLMIFGWRGDTVVDLVQPLQTLRFSEVRSWSPLVVQERLLQDAAWGCYGTRERRWEWQLNFFRPVEPAAVFAPEGTLGCLLTTQEPLFSKPVTEAIASIQSAMSVAEPGDVQASERASMTLVMLYLLGGQRASAIEQAGLLATVAAPGSWLAAQVEAFLSAANNTDFTPLQVCAVVAQASVDGVCDPVQVLERLLTEQPFNRTDPLEAQAAIRGLTVLDQTTLSEIGRMDRIAMRFDLTGDQWWAFAPVEADAYLVERIDAPNGFIRPQPLPDALAPTSAAYNALLLGNNPAEVLNILDNLALENPGIPLDSAARFLRALCYDLLGNRSAARQTYYELWRDDPASSWGQLAAAHLEAR
jgi:hypothetical protein